MTREQAEKEIRDTFTKTWADGIIKALEQEPITKNDLGVDCISRADARSLVVTIGRKDILGMSGKTFQDLCKGIDELPSVTPQEPYKEENNLPLCEDVIHGDFTGVIL